MGNSSLIAALAIFTLVVVLAWGLWERNRVRASQAKRGEKPTAGLND